jgi:hypothetical protein
MSPTRIDWNIIFCCTKSVVSLCVIFSNHLHYNYFMSVDNLLQTYLHIFQQWSFHQAYCMHPYTSENRGDNQGILLWMEPQKIIASKLLLVVITAAVNNQNIQILLAANGNYTYTIHTVIP